MKTKSTSILLLFFFLASALQTIGQVKTKIFASGIPASFRPLKSRPGEAVRIAIPAEFTSLKKGYTENDLYRTSNKFAVAVDHEIDLIKGANVFRENGRRIYTLSIKAEGAVNINCQFSEFRLPENAVLKIFTEKEITDSITARENNEHNVWATRVYQGDELHFTLSLPDEHNKELLLKINKVNIGFRPYGVDFGNIGASAPCHRNVVCPEGNGWEPERNSVAIIVANGQEQCTGSLLMNTCNSNIPYFLTANHCLGAGNVPNWVFQFQTWSTDCFANVGWIETVQFNGCQLRANHDASDFALLQLNTVPAIGSNIHYAGWNRQGGGNNSTTVIHHPAGDLMKISIDNQGPVAVNDVTDITRQCWEINQDLGRLEGGSSGAPYFNQDHRVIGQHFRRPQAGTLPICDITVARGGRFEQSWTGGGTNATRLSNWLDPMNTGAVTTNTANRNALGDPVGPLSLSISGGNTVCGATGTFTLNGAPAGATIAWATSDANIATVSGTGTTGTVTRVGHGVITLTASVVGHCALPNATSISLTVGTYNLTHFSVWMNYCLGGSDWEIGFDAVSNMPPQPNLQYVWTDINGNNPSPPTSSNSYYAYMFPPSCFSLGIRALNVCGLGQPLYGGFCPPCGTFRIVTAPNPAKDNLKLIIEQGSVNAKSAKPGQLMEVKLYDFNTQRLVKQWKLNGQSSTHNLNVRGLPKGNYVLDVKIGTDRQTRKIIIE